MYTKFFIFGVPTDDLTQKRTAPARLTSQECIITVSMYLLHRVDYLLGVRKKEYYTVSKELK